MDAHVDWIVHSAGAAILALLWFFFTRDRIANEKRLNELEKDSFKYNEDLVRADEREKNLRNDVQEIRNLYYELEKRLGNAIRRR